MPKRSNEDWQTLIKTFEESPLSQAAFCKQHHLCSKRFAHHRQRLHNPSTKPVFIEAKPPKQSISQASLTYGQVTLQLPLSPLEPTLALIKALS